MGGNVKERRGAEDLAWRYSRRREGNDTGVSLIEKHVMMSLGTILCPWVPDSQAQVEP